MTDRVQLGEVCELRSGVGFPPSLQGRASGQYPFAKVGDISRSARSGSTLLLRPQNFVDESDLATLRAKPFPVGTVAFPKIGEAIRQNSRVLLSQPGLLDNNVMGAIPDERLVDPRYLFEFLSTIDMYPMSIATTVPSLRKSDLTRLGLPLPPIEEQRRIAAVLDKADDLRAKRRRSLDELHLLSHSLFHEMFGLRSSGTPRPLGDVADFFGGASLPVGQPWRDQQSGFLLLKVSDLNREGNEDRIVRSSAWSPGPGSRAATCPAGSVVIPKRGGAIGTNKKRLTTRPSVLDPNLMGIAPRVGELDPVWLLHWFRRLDLATLVSGSSVPQLNKQDLAPLQLVVPPLARQQQFAAKMRSLDAVSAAASESAKAIDRLFASLQRQAFSGVP